MRTQLIKAIGFVLMMSTINVSAQVADTVTILPGYANQTFYSLSNGTVLSNSNTGWDIAFHLKGFDGSILINSKANVQLWNAQKSVADWSTMVAADTNNVVNNPSYEQFNSDSTWSLGAFNRTIDTSNAFDLGWGIYNFTTHNVMGDSVYFLKLGNGVIKKFMIDMLNGPSFKYVFRFADVDGSNEITDSLQKSNFPGKNFIYYSVVSGQSMDREPISTDWDLSFAQYLVTAPVKYKVAGVLQNDSILAHKAYPVDVNNVSATNLTMNKNINVIGFDWKTYDFMNNVWIIEDSLVYFVQNKQGNIYKMIFTGFGGSMTGNYYFTKELVTVGLSESNPIETLGVYPNPANDNARIVLSANTAMSANLMVYDLMGRVVNQMDVQIANGFNQIDLNVSNLTAGIYQVVLQSGNQQKVLKLMVN